MPNSYRSNVRWRGATEEEIRKRNAEIVRLYNLPGHPYSQRKLGEMFDLKNIGQIVRNTKWQQSE